jgi:hypothetical protein
MYELAAFVESTNGCTYMDVWTCAQIPGKGVQHNRIAPAVNLPPLCLYEIVSLIAAIAASIKTFCRKPFSPHNMPKNIRDCEYCMSIRHIE